MKYDPTLPVVIRAKRSFDRFFERRMGGRLAGFLADMRFNRWRKTNPGASYADFYAHRVILRLDAGGAHKTLGRRNYHANTIVGPAPALEPSKFAARGRRHFDWFAARGLRPDMTCVDYGCGSLRVGQHFIDFLEPDRYVGMDVVDRFYLEGLSMMDQATIAAKRPRLAPISDASVSRAAGLRPDLIYSTAVLQHVPPGEIGIYFGRIAEMLCENGVAIVNFKHAATSARIGSNAWTHDVAMLAGALAGIDRTVLLAVEEWAGPADDFAPCMLIMARDPGMLRRWTKPC